MYLHLLYKKIMKLLKIITKYRMITLLILDRILVMRSWWISVFHGVLAK